MRYFLDPFGCVKNQVDAETMMAFLNRAGWEPVPDAQDADLIIINSCGFIESAKQESIDAVLAYRKRYPDKRILLAGCLAQRYPAELAESLTEADAFFGNADLSRISEAAGAALEGSRRALIPEPEPATLEPAALEPERAAIAGGRPLLSLPGSACVKIAEGCNNRCSFCAIPHIRGPLRSRSIQDVLEECRRLLNRGIRELCFIGQDLGAYGRDFPPELELSLAKLLRAVSALEGNFWARLLYIHPDSFPRSILELCREDPRLLPYFDLPFQHGSTETLRAMNRRGDAAAYLALIEDIRSALPGAVIRSTFLTGFPGETEADFQALLDFQAQARLDWLGVFTYSREEGTPAYTMKRRVPRKLAAERKGILEERQIPITEERLDRFIGRELDVLVEERFHGAEGLYLGRLFCQAPEIDGAAVIRSESSLSLGEFARCKVFARAGFDLEVKPL
ncbi:MAG: 30S ribosomal protein S12 methylthiotransferase RimO [Treponema sp.]|nr:30S ribosomal protein S12 methylthiotransferase RimO [Treponema sp.]